MIFRWLLFADSNYYFEISYYCRVQLKIDLKYVFWDWFFIIKDWNTFKENTFSGAFTVSKLKILDMKKIQLNSRAK